MDISRLSIKFYRGYKKEYFHIPSNVYAGYSAWNPKLAQGCYPEVKFHKKDPICLVMHKSNSQWLHDDNDGLIFRDLSINPLTLSYEQPLALWIAYPKEGAFILYKTTGMGDTNKQFIKYSEKEGKVNIRYTNNISNATLFLYNPFD